MSLDTRLRQARAVFGDRAIHAPLCECDAAHCACLGKMAHFFDKGNASTSEEVAGARVIDAGARDQRISPHSDWRAAGAIIVVTRREAPGLD